MGQEKEYSLKYHRLVSGDVAKLDSFWRMHIRTAIEQKLLTQPGLFGKPLRHSLKGCRSFRVSDYRVIYTVVQRMVRVLIIGHRSDVYEKAEERLE